MKSQVVPLTRAELLALPAAVSVEVAARALGIGRSKAHEMVRAGEFPVRVLRLGNSYRISSADLLELLNIKPDGTVASADG